MSNQLGLWIDHKKAVIVFITETREKIKDILSEVETQPRRSGDS